MITEPIETYHANSAVSHSKLETFRRRPVSYRNRYITRTTPPPEVTSAFRLGSAAHCAILEAEEFPNRFVEKPDIDRRTTAGKAAYAEFAARHDGMTIVDREDMDAVRMMYHAVDQHPLAAQLLKDGEPELVWRTSGAMPLQCRTDWFNANGCELSEGRPYVADLKTVESLDSDAFRNFERAVFSYGYHRQAGFYLPLITELFTKPVFDFFFIAVEKIEPFGVAVYRLSDDAVARGQDESIQDLRGLKLCMHTGDWPNIEPKLREIGLPKWYGEARP